MKTSHTATPWRYDALTGVIHNGEENICHIYSQDINGLSSKNADFIILACNAHDDLVTDVKFLLEYFEDAIEYSGYDEDTKTKLRDRYKAILATLAKAEK